MLRRAMQPASGPLTPEQIESLIAAASGGDPAALERLLGHYHPRLAGFVARKIGVDWQGKIEPEDVLQEAYIDAFRLVRGFVAQGPDSFYHWMSRIIDHRFIDRVRHLKRAKRDTTREVSGGSGGSGGAGSGSRHTMLLDRVAGGPGSPSIVARGHEAIAALMACIAQLPEDYRVVVTRLYLNEEPLADVARDLARSEDAVRRLGSRAIEKLEQCMGRATKFFSRSD